MVLTSIHHIYGAAIYHTPWRLHVLMVSVPVIILTLTLHYVLIHKPFNKPAFVIYGVVVFIPSICMIGLFEGFYNHFVKDLMFYTGFSRETLTAMFPPPEYEMPNDFVFEFTGILQAVICVWLIVCFARLVREHLKRA